MRRLLTTTTASLAMMFGHTGLAGTAQAAELFVVHGINGTDLGLEEALSVDIEVNETCAFSADFEGVLGPLRDQPAGVHDVAIYLGDGDDELDCDPDALMATGSFDVSLLETAIFIAHLDVNGAPVLSKFATDASDPADGNARTTFYHAAKAPLVDFRLRDDQGRRVRGLQGFQHRQWRPDDPSRGAGR